MTVPRMVLRHAIEERLGAGGLGVVYRAVDTRLDRVVALKVLPELAAADPAARARLLAEAPLDLLLDHKRRDLEAGALFAEGVASLDPADPAHLEGLAVLGTRQPWSTYTMGRLAEARPLAVRSVARSRWCARRGGPALPRRARHGPGAGRPDAGGPRPRQPRHRPRALGEHDAARGFLADGLRLAWANQALPIVQRGLGGFAAWHAAQGRTAHAIAWLTAANAHPAADRADVDANAGDLSEWLATMSPDEAADAQARGRRLRFDEVVTEALALS